MERKDTRKYKGLDVFPHGRYFPSERLIAGLVAMMFLIGISYFGLRWIESAITFSPDTVR
jgi:hypothetical protein